jgi:GNAT superfamily N-acetyltransferase
VHTLAYDKTNQRSAVTYRSASAIITFHEYDRTIWISHLIAYDRRKGHATRLLTDICLYADEYGYALELEADHWNDEDGMNDEQLRTFYTKFGFHSWRYWDLKWMIRKIYGPYNEPQTILP